MFKKISFKKVGLAVGMVSLAALASACGGTESRDESQDAATSESAMVMANANDVMFAQMMIPHHEQAVVMADLALAKSNNPEIVGIATEIKGAQGPEIELMASWLNRWGAPRISGEEAMMSHGSHGMTGMLTDEQLAQLEAAQGEEFDRLFTEFMIEHHEGAVAMAQDVMAGGQEQEVLDLASQIIEVQEREIAALKAMMTK